MPSSNVHMLFMSVQIAFSCMAPFGFATTFLNTPVEEFKNYLNESYSNELSTGGYETLWNVIQNLWLVGFLFGLFLSPLLNDRFGRRVGLLFGNCCNLVTSIVQWSAVAFHLPPLLIIGRLASSIATAVAFQSIILYLQEFPPTEKRGTTSYMSDVVFSLFAFICMSLGTKELLGDRLPVLMTVQIGLCERPVVLPHSKASRVAEILADQYKRREGHEEIEHASSMKDVITIFTEPALRKTMLLGLAAVQMVVPMWTFLFNSTDLLLDMNASKFISQWTSSAMIVCYFIGSLLGGYLIDRVGRRTLFIPCSSIIVICVGAISLSFYLSHLLPNAEILAVASLLVTGVAYGTGVASMAWFISPELSPQRYRSLIQSIVAALNTLQSALFTFAVMPLYRTFGAWVFLILFCVPSTLCDIFLNFELPETKGRPISEITEEIRSGLRGKSKKNCDVKETELSQL